MSSSKMTLIGMNIFFNNMNDDLFKNLHLPEGLTKKTLTDNILLRGGEFEVQYSDPTAMQSLIGIWSDRQQPTFDRWVRALAIEYAPLENYDRNEYWKDVTDEDTSAHNVETANSTTNENASLDRTINGTTSGTSSSQGTTSTTNSDTSELLKSAYDESSYSPYEKTINSGSVNSTVTDSTTTSGTTSETTDEDTTGRSVTDNTSNNNATGTLDRDYEHRGRIHGNIGVTTSQQMLEAELNLGYWNVYEKITELFLQEFVIPVYA